MSRTARSSWKLLWLGTFLDLFTPLSAFDPLWDLRHFTPFGTFIQRSPGTETRPPRADPAAGAVDVTVIVAIAAGGFFCIAAWIPNCSSVWNRVTRVLAVLYGFVVASLAIACAGGSFVVRLGCVSTCVDQG